MSTLLNTKPSHVLVGFYLLMICAFLVGFFFVSEQESKAIKFTIPTRQKVKTIAMMKEDDELIKDSTLRSPNFSSPLHLAWLASFPNSGTSYTLNMIKKVTGKNTASNYGSESRGENGMSVGVYAKNDTALSPPFWIDPTSRILSRPSKGLILTKTHCGSRCNNCGVTRYVENHNLFLKHCLEGRFTLKDRNGQLTEKLGSYDKNLVKRAVHLIRDPFDNVVSRFHLHYKNLVKKNRTDQIVAYPRTREGFRKFCTDEGVRFATEEKQSKFYKDFFEVVKNVPCHADFFRYIQWHNLAFITVWDLNIPSIVIHYENYTHNFNQTKNALLDFLGQDDIYDAPEFVTGKTYRDYYTAEEIDAVHILFTELALEKTMLNTKHYFV